MDPAKIIPLKLTVNDFSYAGRTFGSMSLAVSSVKNGLHINELSIKNNIYQLNTQGEWLRIKGKDQSSFSGSLVSTDLGKLLKEEKFTTHLSGGDGHANFTLAWPDSPSNFQSMNLEGDIDAEFSDGTITGLDAATNEKIGLGKLINALSFQSIAQHLTFNFKEKDGFYFSVAKGRVDIKNSRLNTNNFYVDGPVAEIYMNGSIGLKAQDYDLSIKINPYFTSSLPIIAALAINPLVGAATWAASKVVRYGLEKAIVYEYHVGGTWKAPVITSPNQTNAAPVSSAQASVVEANPTTTTLNLHPTDHQDVAPIASAQPSTVIKNDAPSTA